MSRVDSQSLTGKTPFLTTCDVMKFAEMGHLREVCLDLPVSLLRVLHAKWLECEKSMELMASFHRSCIRQLRWDCGSTARLFPFLVVQEGTIKTLTLLFPTRYVVVSATAWMDLFAIFIKTLQKS